MIGQGVMTFRTHFIAQAISPFSCRTFSPFSYSAKRYTNNIVIGIPSSWSKMRHDDVLFMSDRSVISSWYSATTFGIVRAIFRALCLTRVRDHCLCLDVVHIVVSSVPFIRVRRDYANILIRNCGLRYMLLTLVSSCTMYTVIHCYRSFAFSGGLLNETRALYLLPEWLLRSVRLTRPTGWETPL
jgi:hypothetical protein